jgi:hypothetical protein
LYQEEKRKKSFGHGGGHGLDIVAKKFEKEGRKLAPLDLLSLSALQPLRLTLTQSYRHHLKLIGAHLLHFSTITLSPTKCN